MDDEGQSSTADSKVERLIERYGLEGFGDELEAAWTAEGADRKSLRQLATELNHAVLEAAMRDAGVETFEGEVENVYRLLTDDAVTAGTRTETRSRLEQAGVDVDALESDFVSHQSVHTFLTDRRGAAYEAASGDARTDTVRDSVRRLRGRLESVAESNVDRLSATGDLDVGDVEVIHSLDVVCNDCGSRFSFEELVTRGGCACETSDEE